MSIGLNIVIILIYNDVGLLKEVTFTEYMKCFFSCGGIKIVCSDAEYDEVIGGGGDSDSCYTYAASYIVCCLIIVGNIEEKHRDIFPLYRNAE